MRKGIWEKMKKKDIGAMGVGAMIVFIAMVLVAGIAAAVLIQTANRLEIQAMQTGEQTKGEVATGLRVVDIQGFYSTRNLSNLIPTGDYNISAIHNMTILVAPRAGSLQIDLSTTVIEISDSERKAILNYSEGDFQSAVLATGVFLTPVFDLAAYQFGVIVLQDADDSCQSGSPVINRGDKVMLSINVSASFLGLSERTDVWGRVVPEEGSPAYFAFRTPATYTQSVYKLY